MSVDQGVVRVEILGLGGGIGRTVVLAKGETLNYKGLEIVFDDFDMSDFDPEAGKINFGVIFNVEVDGQKIEVVPTYRGGMRWGAGDHTSRCAGYWRHDPQPGKNRCRGRHGAAPGLRPGTGA